MEQILSVSENIREGCIDTVRSRFPIEYSAKSFLKAINSLTNTGSYCEEETK